MPNSTVFLPLHKKISFFSEIRKLNNPYELYRFEDFMNSQFDNFKKKKNFFRNNSKIEKILCFRNFFPVIFAYLKKINLIITKIFSSFLGVLILFFFLKKYNYLKNFGFLILLWNSLFFYIIFKFLKFLFKIVYYNYLLKKTRPTLDKFNFLSIKIYEIGIFLNGGIRTLNLLAN